ncbi:MAG: hypothetical protein ACR2NP_13610 [Pirellulaceae bacterium]
MLIPMIVVAVLSIALIFFLVKSAPTWNWVQITFVALIFLTSIFACIVGARALKTRTAWMLQHENNLTMLTQQQSAFDEALYGPSDAVEYGEGSLRYVNSKLRLNQIGTGRFWTHASASGDNGQITLTFRAGEGQAPASGQIKQDMELHAFADGGADVEGTLRTVPVDYIGTYKVVSVDTTNNAITMEPVFVTNTGQAEAAEPTRSWSVFEQMPGDSRTAFTDHIGVDVDMTAMRQALRDIYLPAEMLGMDPASEEYESLLDEYTFDGQTINAIETWIGQQTDRINDRFDPPDDQRKTRVVFRSKSEAFDVDAEGDVSREGLFNLSGQAVSKPLHLGRDVEFPKDGELVVSKPVVDGYDTAGGRQPPLTATSEAEAIEDYYVRPLRDYPFSLRELGELMRKTSDASADLDQDIQVSENMLAKTEAQINHRADVILKLQSDLTQLTRDLEIIGQLNEMRETQLQQCQDDIRTYYNQIQELYKQENEPAEFLDTRAGQPERSLADADR